MNIVIAGGGEIGTQIAKALHNQHNLTLLDINPDAKERLAGINIKVVIGSISSPDDLREARIDICDVFIATTNYDEVNLIACMLAKGLGAKKVLCFVGKQSYMDTLTDPQTIEIMGTRIDELFWPQQSLAKEIVEIIRVPGALDTEVLLEGRLRYVEYLVRTGGYYEGKRVASLEWPEGCFLAGMLREGRFHAVTDEVFGEIHLKAKDRIFFSATNQGFDEIQGYFSAKGGVRRVMIVGGGNVGLMVAKELVAAKIEVTMVDTKRERCLFLAEQIPQALVLNADGTDLELLHSEGLSRMDAVVAVTENDEKNLLISLLAKQHRVPKVVTRVNRTENKRLFENVGIDIPLTPRAAAVRDVVDWIAPEHVNHLRLLEDEVELLQFEVDSHFKETPFQALNVPDGASIIAVQRGTRVYLPSRQLAVMSGDKLMVLCSRTISKKVIEMLS